MTSPPTPPVRRPRRSRRGSAGSSRPARGRPQRRGLWAIAACLAIAGLLGAVGSGGPSGFRDGGDRDAVLRAREGYRLPPLAMRGGDPHLRALMRTISASESNARSPYAVLYGGGRIDDLSRHPRRCVPIRQGPNAGRCSTAAGRYQILDETWAMVADRYHPKPSGWLQWRHYSFEPFYQDVVVYRWLADTDAWGMDLAAELEAGNLDRVLERLSGTWTSLGYGIEDNNHTGALPSLYWQLLEDERQRAAREGDRANPPDREGSSG